MQQQSDTSTSAMIIVKLEEQDSVKSFDCGDDDLNDFILHESPLYRKEKLAVTYVLKEADDLANEHIKAFFKELSRSQDRSFGRTCLSKRYEYRKYVAQFHQALLHSRQQDRLPLHHRRCLCRSHTLLPPQWLRATQRRGCRRTHAVALLRPQRLGRRLIATPILFPLKAN